MPCVAILVVMEGVVRDSEVELLTDMSDDWIDLVLHDWLAIEEFCGCTAIIGRCWSDLPSIGAGHVMTGIRRETVCGSIGGSARVDSD